MSCRDGLEDLMLAVARGAPREGGADAHLASCASCRSSLALFRAAGALPPIDDEDRAMAARLVARTLAPRAVAALPAAVDSGDEDDAAMAARLVARAMAPSRGARVSIPRWAAVAAAIVLTAGAASAALWTGKRLLGARRAIPAAPPAATHSAGHGHGVAARVPVETIAAPPAVAVDVPAIAPIAPPPASSSRPSSTSARPSAHWVSAGPPASVEPPPIVTAPPASIDTPESLLRAANDARRARRFDEASRGYEALQARFPTSREAIVSHLSLGNVALERGAFEAALAAFDAYLAAGAAELGEEALLGKARALAGLGRAADERAAWRALEAQYPMSEYRWRARTRLRELEGEGAR
jgi:TolA-binding protein